MVRDVLRGIKIVSPRYPVMFHALVGGTSVELFGATGDGITDDTSAIQSTVDSVNALGGGVVLFPEGTFLVSAPIVIYSNIHLQGVARDRTTIKLDAAVNDNVIETYNFDSLTSTTAWDVANDGVPYGFAIKDLSVDGNKTNQTMGADGIKIFGKGYIIDNVTIYNCYANGLYTEIGSATGQNDRRDMPESQIGPLWIRSVDANGVEWRGPNDANISYLAVAGDGGTTNIGFNAPSGYTNNFEAGHIHVYGATQGVVLTETNAYIDFLEVESCKEEGLVIAPTANTHRIIIGNLVAFSNMAISATGTASLDIQGETHISNLWLMAEMGDDVGLLLSGFRNNLSNMFITGDNKNDSIGLHMNTCNDSVITGRIQRFNQSGAGIGLQLTNCNYNKVRLNFDSNDYHINVATVGTYNTFDVSGEIATGDAAWSAELRDQTEDWLINFKDNDAAEHNIKHQPPTLYNSTLIGSQNSNKTTQIGKIMSWDLSTLSAHRTCKLPVAKARNDMTGVYVETAGSYRASLFTDSSGSLINGVDHSSMPFGYLQEAGDFVVLRAIKAGGAGDTAWSVEHDSRSAVIAFASADATPSVAGGRVFATANAGATIITDFDDGKPGQVIVVKIGDANTIVDFTLSGLKGNAGMNWSPIAGDSMICVYDGEYWLCTISDNTA